MRLVALWVRGITADQLKGGTPVALKWNGLLEANPVQIKDPQKQSCFERIDYFRTFSISNSRSNRIQETPSPYEGYPGPGERLRSAPSTPENSPQDSS